MTSKEHLLCKSLKNKTYSGQIPKLSVVFMDSFMIKSVKKSGKNDTEQTTLQVKTIPTDVPTKPQCQSYLLLSQAVHTQLISWL